jgi:hypothetical protein
MDRVATSGTSEGPEEGSLLAEDVRCCGNRRGSRVRQQKQHWPEDGTGLTVGDIGWRHGRQRSDPQQRGLWRQNRQTREGPAGRSEAKAVKHEASSTSLERVDSHAEFGCSSLTTWDARVDRKHLWSVKARSRKAESRDLT